MICGGIKPLAASGRDSESPAETVSTDCEHGLLQQLIAGRFAADPQGRQQGHAIAEQRAQHAAEPRHGRIVKDLAGHRDLQFPAVEPGPPRCVRIHLRKPITSATTAAATNTP